MQAKSGEFLDSLKKKILEETTMNSDHDVHSLTNKIMTSMLGNKICADCKAPKMTSDWASINQGVCICLSCSGRHRALTVQFSKVKSILMDKIDPLTEDLMTNLGNNICNIINEFDMPSQFTEQKSRE